MHYVMVVHCYAPPGQAIECHYSPRATGAEGGPHALAHFLAMEDRSEHRQHCFHHQLGIPGATRTDLHIGGSPGLRMEPCIGQDGHHVGNLGNQRLKIRGVGGGAVPGTDQAPLVQDGAQFAAHNTAMVTLAFLAHLGGAARNRAVHAVCVLKSRAKRVRSGT